MIDVSLATLLQSLAPGVAVEQGTISDEKLDPRIFFERSNENQDVDLDGTQGLTTTTFTIEVASLDIDAVQTLATSIRHALNGRRGAFGSDWALSTSVEDADDSYEPKTLNADEGYHIAAFSVIIIS